MSFNPRHAFRMAKWARNPPSKQQVRLVLIVLGTCLLLWGLERLFGFPAWLVPDQGRMRF
ncbi:MAG: hypothetical protein ACRBCL_10610 [Maritimibacter sp.]